MHLIEVIKKPILTEKTYSGHANGVYAFVVDLKSNKTQIKKTFEQIFQVKVESVRTMKYDAKEKKVGKYVGKKSAFKKAIITLKEGEKLDLLQDL